MFGEDKSRMMDAPIIRSATAVFLKVGSRDWARNNLSEFATIWGSAET